MFELKIIIGKINFMNLFVVDYTTIKCHLLVFERKNTGLTYRLHIAPEKGSHFKSGLRRPPTPFMD